MTRVSEGIMFLPCVFVCVCLCLSRCLSGRFDYEGLVPHKRFLQVPCWGCLVVQVMFHTRDVIDDVTRSQSRSNFEIDISPSIFQLERRSKAQMSEMLMAIFMVYSTSGINSCKACRELKMMGILKIFKYQAVKFVANLKWRQFWKFQIDLRYEKIIPNYAQKSFVMVTSSMTSQGGLKFGPLYSFINEITFFLTKKQAKISSLNFLCIGIMWLWLYLYKFISMT